MAMFKNLFATERLTGLKRAKIDASTVGNNTLVAAVTGKKIRVYQFVLVASVADTVAKFQSGAAGTDITGPMEFANSGGLSVPFCPVGHFETAEGSLLNLSLSGAGAAVGGWLVYAEV